MHRWIAAFGALMLAASPSAQAQVKTYCGGAVVAENFTIRPPPGPNGRTSYFVLLRNTTAQPRQVQLVPSPRFPGQPGPSMQTLPANGTVNALIGTAAPPDLSHEINRAPPLPNLADELAVNCL